MPTSNHQKYRRRSIRLKDYDYSQSGAYFVTINTFRRELLFGQISCDIMSVNELGKVAQSCWEQIPRHFPTAHLDAFIVMPNHIHGIIVICRGTACRAPTPSIESFGKPQKNSLPTIIRSFKSAATIRINKLRRISGEPVWQRNYYEHIIRDDEELNEIREYIVFNTGKWTSDPENPVVSPRL